MKKSVATSNSKSARGEEILEAFDGENFEESPAIAML